MEASAKREGMGTGDTHVQPCKMNSTAKKDPLQEHRVKVTASGVLQVEYTKPAERLQEWIF